MQNSAVLSVENLHSALVARYRGLYLPGICASYMDDVHHFLVCCEGECAE